MTTAAVMPISEVQNGYVDTWNIGGDRFSFLAGSMFSPQAYVGLTDTVPIGLLSVPPTYDQLSGMVGGMGQTYNNAGAIAAGSPWNPRKSLVPWVLFGLIIGWLGVHHLYYKRHR